MFGPALRKGFGPNGDIDIVVTFAAEADWELLDHMKMQQELQSLLHRNVDLITKTSPRKE